MVDVLMGDHDQLDVLDRMAGVRELALELVQRLARIRPRVDEGERLVLDQVAVDPADRERRGDLQAVNASLGGSLERLLRSQFAHRPRNRRNGSSINL